MVQGRQDQRRAAKPGQGLGQGRQTHHHRGGQGGQHIGMATLERGRAQDHRHHQQHREGVAHPAGQQQQQTQLQDVEAQLKRRLPLPQHPLRREGQDQGQVEHHRQDDHPETGQKRHLEAEQEARGQQGQHLPADRRPAQTHQGAQPQTLARRAAALLPGGGAPGERLRLRTLVGLRWAAIGGQQEFLEADLAVEIQVGAGYRLGHVEQAELRRAVKAGPAPPKRHLGQATGRLLGLVRAADGLDALAGEAAAHLGQPGQHLGSHLFLVAGGLNAVDHAVVVSVQGLEEGFEVGPELLARQLAVMVGVGLGEPSGYGVGLARACVEGLAGGADEQAVARSAVGLVAVAGAGGQDQGEEEGRGGGEGRAGPQDPLSPDNRAGSMTRGRARLRAETATRASAPRLGNIENIRDG